MKARFPWLWDTELGNEDFEVLLRGEGVSAGHDVRWALLRLIEYAPYSDLRRHLPRERFLREWPALSPRVRSRTRREGMEFLYHWFQEHRRPDA
jgi:hypothetical protein